MYKSQAMSNNNIRDKDALPKSGKVTEMCQEWMVREDGALAYRLQNQEISEHYSGNKQRNQTVREDFPHAKTEQLREQQLAEQAAAVYHRMLQEQEEQDNKVAQQLAERLEREEKLKKRALEIRDQNVVRQLLERERLRVENLHMSPQRPDPYQANLPVKRGARPLPLPESDVYTEPYLVSPLDKIEVARDEKQIQEERDAELARKLQQQEGEDTLLNRDRLLAIEAQDKELAKLLQERERNKAKRARERAKQKALAKKQQEQQTCQTEDSYALPVDLVPAKTNSLRRNSETYAIPNQNVEDDFNYSLPVDVLPPVDLKKIINDAVRFEGEREVPPPVRPTQLDLRSPLNRISTNKPRYPDPLPESYDTASSSPSQLVNIAMAIDPTYPRRGIHSPSSYDTSSSTVTTSTSSSPGVVLPPPDVPDVEEESAVPPYMPIQGQRRTASLEKKQKKKSRDGGCKQQ